MLGNILKQAITAGAFASMIRLACPYLFGAIGGSLNNVSGTFNISYEAVMLFGCFFSVLGSYLTGSPFVGLLFGMLIGIVIASIFGVWVLRFKANPIIAGIALNAGAWACTTFLLVTIFGVRGRFSDPKVVSFSNIEISLFGPDRLDIPFLNTIFSNNNWMVYTSYLLVIIAWIVMYKTPFGLRMRGIGQNPEAAATAGVNINRYKWISLIIMGAFTGMAGSYLTLSGISGFSENMTSGKGFLCLISISIAKGNPLKILGVVILFAYCESLMLVLGTLSLPTQIISTIPYVAAVLMLFANGVRNFKGVSNLEL